jgi:hypothetical protein
VPSEFVSWIIQHVGVTLGASIVVANYSVVALRDTLALEPGRARRPLARGRLSRAGASICVRYSLSVGRAVAHRKHDAHCEYLRSG